MTHIRRVMVGTILGEAFLVISLLDIARGKWMASASGVDMLKWLCPFGQLMTWISYPVWWLAQSPHLREQPLRLFAIMAFYWAIVGVVIVHVALFVKCWWTRG